ncbi:MAG: exo-alpha-sialidase, partial [candidate division Zixibacteria bacterium]|nr:exo-alpha-sialidase [candidate division Zixibacteria bacterium]
VEDPPNNIPTGYLRYVYGSENDFTETAVSVTLENMLDMGFPEGRLIFKVSDSKPVTEYTFVGAQPVRVETATSDAGHVFDAYFDVEPKSVLEVTLKAEDDEEAPTVEAEFIIADDGADPTVSLTMSDSGWGLKEAEASYSTDGGLTWIDSLVSKSMQIFGWDSQQSDPTLNADRLGNFIMSALDWDAFGSTGLSTIAFYRSTDKGVSWTGPVPCVWSGSNVTFEDKQFIAIDRTGGIYDGNVYCMWARFYDGPNRLQFVRSTDGVQTFEDTIIVGPQQFPSGCGVRDAGQFSFPLVNSNGDVHAFWQGFAYDSSGNCTGVQTIKHAISADGGQSFTYPDTVLTVSGYQYAAGGINTYSAPAADADITGGPFDGNIYISFTNIGPEDGSRSDVDFVRSTDNGVTWSPRLQIDDAIDADLNDGFHPWLIVNQEGVIVVIFYDQRFDSPNYLLFDCIAAYSFDGGLTFTSNHRISSVSSNPGDLKSDRADLPAMVAADGSLTPLALSRAGLIGEYIGVTAYYDKINATWTDSRDGNSEVYTANWYLPLLEPRLAAPEIGSYHGGIPSFAWS